MTIDREELRRLCEAATPGPWRLHDMEHATIVAGTKPGLAISRFDAKSRADATNGANAAFAMAARTAIPALLDALEEEEAKTSALNGDVTELGQKLEAAEAREKKLLAAVKNIAKQMLHSEITDCDPDEIDWLSGYEGCVKEARSTLAEIAP